MGTAALPVQTEMIRSEEDLVITENSEGLKSFRSPKEVGEVMINTKSKRSVKADTRNNNNIVKY